MDAWYIEEGDLDGDGDLDLAAVDLVGSIVAIFSNNGDGTFAPYTSAPIGEYTIYSKQILTETEVSI